MEKYVPVVAVDECNILNFQNRCADLVNGGYKLVASSCGFINSEDYGYASQYQAIFIDEKIKL